MNNESQKESNSFKSMSNGKKILVFFIVFLFSYFISTLLMDKKSSSSSEEANFWEHEFTSRTGTVFGMSGYNSVNFWENGKVEYCNKYKYSNDKNASFYCSNLTKGTWKFVDNEKLRIQVEFLSGNNADKAGLWEFFDKTYHQVNLPDGQRLTTSRNK